MQLIRPERCRCNRDHRLVAGSGAPGWIPQRYPPIGRRLGSWHCRRGSTRCCCLARRRHNGCWWCCSCRVLECRRRGHRPARLSSRQFLGPCSPSLGQRIVPPGQYLGVGDRLTRPLRLNLGPGEGLRATTATTSPKSPAQPSQPRADLQELAQSCCPNRSGRIHTNDVNSICGWRPEAYVEYAIKRLVQVQTRECRERNGNVLGAILSVLPIV